MNDQQRDRTTGSPTPEQRIRELQATLQEKEKLIQTYQRLHELTITERQEADSIITAHESVEALARNEIEQLHRTIHAHEEVEDLARQEIDTLLRTVEAQEHTQELARSELLTLHQLLDSGDPVRIPVPGLEEALLDAEKTIKAFENLQDFQDRQFRYYDGLIQAYENVGTHFSNEIRQLSQIVKAHEAVEELARKEMLSLHDKQDADLKDRDDLISKLNRQLQSSEKTLEALDSIMEHQLRTKQDLDRTIEAYKNLSRLSSQELDSAYRAIRIHEELEKLAWQEKEEVDQDLLSARKVQERLLIGVHQSAPHYLIASRYIPSARLGGDFYGSKLARHGRLSLLMSDAAGHGAQAALIAAMVKTLFEEYAPRYVDPARLLTRLNTALCTILKDVQTFITAVNIVIDPATMRLTYANGGHPFAWVAGPGGSFRELGETGGLLGAFPELRFRKKSVTLTPGDMILLFTDGVVESLDDEEKEYGTARLKRIFIDHHAEEPEALVGRIGEEIIGYHGSSRFEDDLSIMAVRIR